MGALKVNEEKAVKKYLNSSNPLSFIPLFGIRGKVTFEYIEYIPIKNKLISFNPQ